MRSAAKGLVVLTAFLVLGAGCRTMTGQSFGTNVDNKTTTAAVKTRLTADKLQNLTWVGVETNDGTVYLTGTAGTQQDKARAAEIAGQVEGVRRVVNNIQVRTAESSGMSPAASPASTAENRHTLTAEVATIDRSTGRVLLQTSDGQMLMQLPPAALGDDIQAGDQVTVDIGIRKVR